MPLSSNEKELTSVIQRKFCGSKRIRKILNPEFLFDSVYRKFDIPNKEQEQIKTMCQGHSEHLDLKWHAETRKTQGNEFKILTFQIYISISICFLFFFQHVREKHAERMATDWADPILHRAGNGQGSLPRSGRERGVLRTMMMWMVGVQYCRAWLPTWRRLTGLHYRL